MNIWFQLDMGRATDENWVPIETSVNEYISQVSMGSRERNSTKLPKYNEASLSPSPLTLDFPFPSSDVRNIKVKGGGGEESDIYAELIHCPSDLSSHLWVTN